MLYKPRGPTKRRRKECPYCHKKFTIDIPVFQVEDEKEAIHKLQSLQQNDHNAHDHFDPAQKKLRKKVKKEFKDLSDFSHKYPPGHGHRQSPNDHDPKVRVELDRWEATAVFAPELFGSLVQLNYPLDKKRYCIPLKYTCGTFLVYSTGLVVIHLDTSRGDYVAQAEGVLKWLGALSGLETFTIKEGGTAELTINVDCESPLAQKISDTLPEGTNLAIMQPIGTLKAYRRGEECKEWRIEANKLPTLLRGIREFIQEKVPNVTFKDRIWFINQEVKQRTLERMQGELKHSTQSLQTIQLQASELDGQVQGVTNILGELNSVQGLLSQNLVELTRFMDSVNGQVGEINKGVTDLLIIRPPGPITGKKLGELNRLLEFLDKSKECLAKQVCAHFKWSGGKVHRLLHYLMELGEITRRKAPPLGRGRPHYLYQKRSDLA